mmetsp:Transcript_15353/g.14722  ORF Transcript_15353/g.14722 Transcript_15353/m.14722 type:complete len:435 (+) Transcript_15353:281-1585(+)
MLKLKDLEAINLVLKSNAELNKGILCLPYTLISCILTEFLSLETLSQFDIAVCNRIGRPFFLEYLKSEYCILNGDKELDCCSRTISWMKSRSIKIRHLKCCRITDTLAKEIADFGNCLQWLSMAGGERFNRQKETSITDIGMVELVNGCPNLRTLDISRASKVTDETLVRLTLGCPHLHSLNISYCSKITDISLMKIAETYHNMHTLNLEACVHITNSGIIRMVEKCPKLQSLNISHIIADPGEEMDLKGKLDDVTVFRIVEGLPLLKSLNLSLPPPFRSLLTDASMIRLAESCCELENLAVMGSYLITDVGVSELVERCPKTCRLDLSSCTITNTGVIEIAHRCPNLKNLYLDSSQIRDFSIVEIAKHCPALQHLDIVDCDEITDRSIHALSKGCPYLEKLRHTSQYISYEALDILAEACPNWDDDGPCEQFI